MSVVKFIYSNFNIFQKLILIKFIVVFFHISQINKNYSGEFWDFFLSSLIIATMIGEIASSHKEEQSI